MQAFRLQGGCSITHNRRRANQFGGRGGGHDESARMFKPKYFQMYKNLLFYLIGLGWSLKRKKSSPKFSARIISNLPEFISSWGQVPSRPPRLLRLCYHYINTLVW